MTTLKQNTQKELFKSDLDFAKMKTSNANLDVNQKMTLHF